MTALKRILWFSPLVLLVLLVIGQGLQDLQLSRQFEIAISSGEEELDCQDSGSACVIDHRFKLSSADFGKPSKTSRFETIRRVRSGVTKRKRM